MKEASVEFLRELLEEKAVTQKQLNSTWKRRYAWNVARYKQLMPLLPKSLWHHVLRGSDIWDDIPLLKQLAEAGIDFNAPVDDEGATPITFATRAGHKAAVKWLMQHGADPEKFDNFGRNAFSWTDYGPGFSCLKILERCDENQPDPGPPSPDAPGIAVLSDAGRKLPDGTDLYICIQVKSPPSTRIEKNRGVDVHYNLKISFADGRVTVQDMNSLASFPLYAAGWPTHLFAPILMWPELTPVWESMEVYEFELAKAVKSRKYKPRSRPDLIDAARSALEQAFDAREAAARKIEVRK